MKTSVHQVSQVRREVEVEIPAEEVGKAFDRMMRHARKTIAVPGFRKGKAPMELVRHRIGDLSGQVAEQLVEFYAPKAIHEEGLEPIDGSVTMKLDEDGGDELPPAQQGEAYQFKLAVDVFPEFEVDNYVDIKISKPEAEVAVEDVQKELDRMRQSLAKMVPVEGRASQNGDFIEVDIEGSELGAEQPVFERKTQTVHLGDEGNLPAFDTGLTGLRAGEDFAFEVTYPEDAPHEALRNKVVYFRGDVRNVLQREVPELDDETVKNLGDEEIDSLAKLRERIEASLKARKEYEAEQVVRRRLVDKILDDHPFEAPPSLAERHLRRRLEGLGRQLAMQGIDPENAGIDWEKVIQEERKNAEKLVREELLLDAIAKKEGLEVVAEEVTAAVDEIARDTGEKAAAIRKNLQSRESLQALKAQILRRKCLDWLFARAHIV